MKTPAPPPEADVTRLFHSNARTHITWVAALLVSFAAEARASGTDGFWGVLSAPVVLNRHCAVFDSLGDRMVVFGGEGGDRVWSLALGGTPTLTPMMTSGPSPGARLSPSAIFDPIGRRMLVYGGATGGTTWALSLTGTPTWSQLATQGTPPPGIWGTSAVYDSRRHRMLVFGGNYSGFIDGLPNPVWSLDLSTLVWSQLIGGGPQPGNRYDHCALYDPVLDRMVITSGAVHGSSFYLSLDTMMWTALSTTQYFTDTRSPIYDPVRRRMLVFGTCANPQPPDQPVGLWEMKLDGVPAWKKVGIVGTTPIPREGHQAIYDATRDRMVVAGGLAPANLPEFWGLPLGANGQWSDLNPDGVPPPALFDRTMVYDSFRRRATVFGGTFNVGSADTRVNEVWALPFDGPPLWTHPKPPGPRPVARSGQSGIYDPVRDRVIIFGGDPGSGSPLLNDVWALSLQGAGAWTQITPGGTPPQGRWGHTAVYDAAGDRMLVFGGSTSGGATNELWSLSLGGSPTWTPMIISPAPPPLHLHSAVMDVARQRMILFGGNSIHPPNNTVWYLSLSGSPFWLFLTTTGTGPTGRTGHTAVLDQGNDRMLIWGGCTPCPEPYALTLGATPTWSVLSPWEPPPPSRSRHQALYDPIQGGMLLMGGVLGDRTVWKLQWDVPVATRMSFVRDEVEWDRVVLTWHGEGSRGEIAQVERRSTSSGWSTLGSVGSDGSDFYRFEDRDVSPGERFGYRLRYEGPSGTATTDEHWVDIPRMRLALHGTSPNPSVGRTFVEFSLADPSPARIEVFDVRGARLWSEDISQLGPGRHRLELSTGTLVPGGIVLIRLSQSTRSVTRRAVLLN